MMMRGWSTQQRRVIDAAGVTLVGIDAKGRPVVQQITGIPGKLREWAVLRSGDPTDVTEPSRRDGGASRLWASHDDRSGSTVRRDPDGIDRRVDRSPYGPAETDTQRNERVYGALRNYVEHDRSRWLPRSDEVAAIFDDLEAILAGEE